MKNKYNLTLEVNNQEIKASNESLEEALLALKQESYKTKGVLSVEYNGKKWVKLLNFMLMRRWFCPRIVNRIVAAKIIKSFLK